MYKQLLILLTALAVSLPAYADEAENNIPAQTAELPKAGRSMTILRTPKAKKGKKYMGVVSAILHIDPSGDVSRTSWEGTQNTAMLNAAKAQTNRPQKFKPKISCRTQEGIEKCEAVPSRHEAVYVFTDKNGNFDRRIHRIKINYPELSMDNNEEGITRLSVIISPKGIVKEINLKESSGHPHLDEAARKAVRKAIFIPSIVNGKAVWTKLGVPIRFKMNNETETEQGRLNTQ